MKYTLIGILIYGFCLLVLWFIRPKSAIHEPVFQPDSRKDKTILALTCVATILICTILMNLPSRWNCKISNDPFHYQSMADSLIHGRIDLDYPVDEKLLEMENPYDPDMRKALDVKCTWDAAFYKGKYYMYFGIVPAILVFAPYYLITGNQLKTYHATQLFTALFIIGLFALFRLLTRKFFKKMNRILMLLSCFSFSLMSVWYIVSAPGMYCLPISAAICFEIWSLYFYMKAVYDEPSDGKAIGLATLGALFGALTFGCRPPVALANLIAIPLAITFIRTRKVNGKINEKLLSKLLIVFLPYVVIGALLMWYNYIRFDNVFEFGQSYQLTLADQSQYGNILSRLNLRSFLDSLYVYLVNITKINTLLDFGILITYPVLLFTGILMLGKQRLKRLVSTGLVSLIITMMITIILIIGLDTVASPFYIPRYRMDFYWLAAILGFMGIGFVYESSSNKKTFSFVLSLLMCLSVAASIALFLTPYDCNFTECYSPVVFMETIRHIFTLGIK